ncbi:MAG: TetR/AcrR family transcriptional regulator [Christensenellales bacterium]
MPDNLSDRRAQRTKRGLQDVLIKLLQTRNLQKISIRELTELADISRGTFYLHYTDIFDLYQAVEDSVVDGITAIVAAPSPVKDEDSLEHMIGAIFEYLAEHINACEALLRTDSASFLAHVFARNRPSSKETWETIFGTDDHARAYSYVFISYGFAGILKHWMDNGKRETPRQIASIVKQLLSSYMLLEDQNESASGTRK